MVFHLKLLNQPTVCNTTPGYSTETDMVLVAGLVRIYLLDPGVNTTSQVDYIRESLRTHQFARLSAAAAYFTMDNVRVAL